MIGKLSYRKADRQKRCAVKSKINGFPVTYSCTKTRLQLCIATNLKSLIICSIKAIHFVQNCELPVSSVWFSSVSSTRAGLNLLTAESDARPSVNVKFLFSIVAYNLGKFNKITTC